MNWTTEEYRDHLRKQHETKAKSVARNRTGSASLAGQDPRGVRPSARSKFHAVKTEVDGIVFDSKAEAARYHELKLMVKAGLIHGLRCQPSYSLDVNGLRLGMYFADFAYYDCTEMEIVEDVKGMATLPLAKWKQKHLKAQYGITVREIR